MHKLKLHKLKRHVGHNFGPPMFTIAIGRVTVWFVPCLVGHSFGPPMFTIAIGRVTVCFVPYHVGHNFGPPMFTIAIGSATVWFVPCHRLKLSDTAESCRGGYLDNR